MSLDKEHVESLLRLIWKKEDEELQDNIEECYFDMNQDSYETD